MGPAVAGALIGAGSSIVSGAITGASNIGAAKMNFRQALQMSREQQNYNSREASYARDWQEKMWNQQNEYSEDVYNRYSSPSAVKRQMLEAGLNPALVMDSGSVGSVATNSPASAPAASASLPTTPQIPYMGYDMLSNGFVNAAQALKAIAEAKKIGVETSQLEQLFGENLKHVRLSNVSLELANSMDAIRLAHLDDKERLAVQQALKTLSLTDVDIDKKRHEIDLIIEQGLIAKNERETWYKKFNAELDNINADTNLKGAQSNAANASANANNALAAFTRTKNVTQQFVNSMNEKFGAEIRACERDLLQQQKAYNQDTYIQRVNMVSSILEKMSWEIEKLRAEGRWAEINQILHAAGSLANTAMNVGIGFSAFKGKAKGILEDAAEAGFYNDNGPVDPPQPFN